MFQKGIFVTAKEKKEPRSFAALGITV